MRAFYIRWVILLAIFGGIAGLGGLRYIREVKTISPKDVMAQSSVAGVRLMGMIEAGSFIKALAGEPFRFNLSEKGEKVAVVFSGEDTDSLLRELKTIVVVGRWDREAGVFHASEIALVPNYGFITSAYVFSLVPLGFFLFYMERRVALLYVMIKEEKAYQAETGQ